MANSELRPWLVTSLHRLPMYLTQDISRYAGQHGMTEDEVIEAACLQYLTQRTLFVQIEDPEAMAAVSHVHIRDYAAANGWVCKERFGHADVYVIERGGDEVELLVPRTDEIGDYASVVRDCIRILADVESRSQIAVYFDVHIRGGRPWLAPHAERI